MGVKNIVYWVAISLFSMLILVSVWNYLFNFEETVVMINKLGYPEHLIHPLIVAQILGLVLISTNMGQWLIEWAYAGFFFNFIFAIIAHSVTTEGNGAGAVLGLVLLSAIYVLNKERKYTRESILEMKEHSFN